MDQLVVGIPTIVGTTYNYCTYKIIRTGGFLSYKFAYYNIKYNVTILFIFKTKSSIITYTYNIIYSVELVLKLLKHGYNFIPIKCSSVDPCAGSSNGM